MNIAIPKQFFAVLVLSCFCVVGAQAQRRQPATATPPAEISGMKIIPYNRSADTFGDDIFKSEEGGFNELDLSFLVKVEVSGPKGEYSSRMLKVTVREGNKLIVNENLMVGIYNENGKSYVAAWIYGPLCSPTIVQAVLSGLSRRSVIKKTLQFQCGE
jgi:hypothetical protein